MNSSGFNDPRFQSDRFSLLTVAEVQEAIRFVEKQNRMKSNIASVSVAKLCMVVGGALGGKQASQKLKLEDFLPYPLKDPEEEREASMTPRTAEIAKRLIKAGILPLSVVSVIATELKKFSTSQP